MRRSKKRIKRRNKKIPLTTLFRKILKIDSSVAIYNDKRKEGRRFKICMHNLKPSTSQLERLSKTLINYNLEIGAHFKYDHIGQNTNRKLYPTYVFKLNSL